MFIPRGSRLPSSCIAGRSHLLSGCSSAVATTDQCWKLDFFGGFFWMQYGVKPRVPPQPPEGTRNKSLWFTFTT